MAQYTHSVQLDMTMGNFRFKETGNLNFMFGSEAPNMNFRLFVSLSLTDTESVHVWSSFAAQHTQSLSINVLLPSDHFPGWL